MRKCNSQKKARRAVQNREKRKNIKLKKQQKKFKNNSHGKR